MSDEKAVPALSLTCKLLRTALPAAQDSENVLLVRVSAGPRGVTTRAPVALAIAADRSGSMEGEPMRCALAACERAIDALTSHDVLSLVAFDSQAEVILPSRRVVSRPRLKRLLRNIGPGGATNLHAGLRAAREQLLLARDERRLLRLMVLTDGEPTVGPRQLEDFDRLAAELHNEDIVVIAVGLGTEFNEQTLAALARATGGSYRFVERPDQLGQVFQRELHALVSVAARDVSVTVRTPRWTMIQGVLKRPVRLTRDTATFELPDLEVGAAIGSLCRLRCSARTPGTYRVAQVVVHYEDCVTGQREVAQVDVEAEFCVEPPAQPDDPEVAAELGVAEASAEIERTIQGLRSSQLPRTVAVHRLTEARTVLLQAGRAEEADQVTRAMTALDGVEPQDPNKALCETVLKLESGKTQILRADSAGDR